MKHHGLPIPSNHRRRSAAALARSAFTIVELMVVVVVIAVLVGILLVSFGGVIGTSRRAVAERQLRVIGQGVDAFNADLGYDPPLLSIDGVRIGNDPPDTMIEPLLTVPESRSTSGDPPSPSDVQSYLRLTRFGSEYTLAAYLMGTGDIDGKDQGGGGSSRPNQGLNTDDDDGKSGPGIRNPGPDRSWGGAAMREAQWTTTSPPQSKAIQTGRVYGPYLDPAGFADSLELDQRTGMFRIVDIWGQPVRFYRDWPRWDMSTGSASRDFSIGWVPIELRTSEAVSHQIADGMPDLQKERAIFNARYMLLSAGKPLHFLQDSKPIPLFGDRAWVDSDMAARITNGTPLPEVQNLAAPFDRASLSEEQATNLLGDLATNVRYVP